MVALLYPGCFRVLVQAPGAVIGRPLKSAAASTLLPHITVPISSTVLSQVPRCHSCRHATTLLCAHTNCRHSVSTTTLRDTSQRPASMPSTSSILPLLVWRPAIHFSSLITIQAWLPPPQHLRSEVGSHRLPPRWHRRRPPISGPPLARAPRAASPQPATARRCRLQARLTPHNRTLAGPPLVLPWPRPAQKHTLPPLALGPSHCTDLDRCLPRPALDAHDGSMAPLSPRRALLSHSADFCLCPTFLAGTRSGSGRQFALLSPGPGRSP